MQISFNPTDADVQREAAEGRGGGERAAGTAGKRQRADAALAGMQNNSWGLRRPLQHKQTTGVNANQNRQQGNLWNPRGENRTLINTDPTLRQISLILHCGALTKRALI